MSRLKTIQLYLSDLKEVLGTHDFISARACLRELGPIDLAEVWSHFSRDERLVIFRLYPRDKALQLFEELEPEEQAEIIAGVQDPAVERLITEIDPAQAGRLLRELPKPLVSKLTSIMRKSARECAQRFSEYPAGTVGSLVRSRFVTVEETWTAKKALESIQLGTRLRRLEETNLDPILVTHPGGKLAGTLPLKALVVAPRDMLVSDVMNEAPIVLDPEMDQEEAVNLFTKYKLKGAPVVAKSGEVLGLVVVKDIFDVAQEEVEEDFEKMAGTAVAETAWETMRLRLPWLIATCVGGILVSSVVKHFEGTLARIVALAAFSPLISGMGGNVGAQTATVMVRGLATGEITSLRERPTVVKEILVGLMMGGFYSVVVGFIAHFIYGDRYGWRFGAVVGSAMLVSMAAAATMGAIQPILLRNLKIDPATATAPFITTTTDLLANIVYFWLATQLLM